LQELGDRMIDPADLYGVEARQMSPTRFKRLLEARTALPARAM
jgi:hypothetical protein